MTIQMIACTTCGALVRPEYKDRHREFHDEPTSFDGPVAAVTRDQLERALRENESSTD